MAEKTAIADNVLFTDLLERARPFGYSIMKFKFPSGLELDLVPKGPETLSPGEQREVERDNSTASQAIKRLKLP